MGDRMSDGNERERSGDTAPSLNGVWFQRERQRIAVGRKSLGLRLGVPEYKLVMLEQRKQQVPKEWFGILAELGFLFPQEVAAELPQVSASRKETVVAEPVALAPSDKDSGPDPNPDSETGAASSLACMSLADAMRIRAAADAASAESAPLSESQTADLDTAMPADTSSANAENQPCDDGTLFRGHWLRQRLQERGIRTRDIARMTQISPLDLGAIERLNLPLPMDWIPELLKHGVFTLAESKAVMQLPRVTSSVKTGLWLREQRGKYGLSHSDVALWLGVNQSDVRRVEERQWPLPDEWFPTLIDLFVPPSVQPKKYIAPTVDSVDSAPPNDIPIPPPKALAKRQSAPQPTTSVPKAETPVPVPRPAPSQTTRELTEAIVNYRMVLGERSGLSAVEVLAQITADLQQAQAKDALSFDQLRAAMNVILGRSPQANPAHPIQPARRLSHRRKNASGASVGIAGKGTFV